MARTEIRSAPGESDRLRDVRRTGPEAQAPSLRGVHAEGTARAWSPCDRRGASSQSQLARGHPEQRDEAWFKGEIVPKLDSFSLKEISKATGLSLAARSRTRSGAKVPHPRHWEAASSANAHLARPADGDDERS